MQIHLNLFELKKNKKSMQQCISENLVVTFEPLQCVVVNKELKGI